MKWSDSQSSLPLAGCGGTGCRSVRFSLLWDRNFSDAMAGKEIEVVLLGMKGGGDNLKPAVWLTARELPFAAEKVK